MCYLKLTFFYCHLFYIFFWFISLHSFLWAHRHAAHDSSWVRCLHGRPFHPTMQHMSTWSLHPRQTTLPGRRVLEMSVTGGFTVVVCLVMLVTCFIFCWCGTMENRKNVKWINIPKLNPTNFTEKKCSVLVFFFPCYIVYKYIDTPTTTMTIKKKCNSHFCGYGCQFQGIESILNSSFSSFDWSRTLVFVFPREYNAHDMNTSKPTITAVKNTITPYNTNPAHSAYPSCPGSLLYSMNVA